MDPAAMMNAATPAALGYRHPAEWETHEATWIGWPHQLTDWPGRFQPIPWVYSEIVRKLAPGEIVRILVNSIDHQKKAERILQRVGVDLGRVEFIPFSTNRGWTRDFGPIFVKKDGDEPKLGVVDFCFNSWAKYPDYELDDQVAPQVAKKFGYELFEPMVNGRRFVLEGGAIDVNGKGTLLTTEECLLDPVVQTRNPGMSREEIEQVLKDYLGVTQILWLGKGIAGDDTHGHLDDLCRFVNPNTVVLCSEKNPQDDNFKPLQENAERLESMRLEDGSKINVVPLPLPSPLIFDGQRLPASYANFLMANAGVLVPTFNDPNDRIALGILSELFTDRPVVGIHAVDLIWGLGAIHCQTHEQPAIM